MFIENFATRPDEHVRILATKNKVENPGFYLYVHGTSVFNKQDFEEAAYALGKGMGRYVRFVTVKGSELRKENGDLVLAGAALSHDHHFAFMVE